MDYAGVQELKKVRRELMDFCKMHSEIYIYSAGKVAESWFELLHDIGVVPQGILVTEDVNQYFHGLSVYLASSMYGQLDEKCGVIAGFFGANESVIRKIIDKKVGVFSLQDDVFCAL